MSTEESSVQSPTQEEVTDTNNGTSGENVPVSICCYSSD